MIKSKSGDSLKNHHPNFGKSKGIEKTLRHKFFYKDHVKRNSALMLSITLMGCNGTTPIEEPCADYDGSEDFICLDSALNGESSIPILPTIEMPSEQIPVFGTDNSDTFVANSGFLTSKTIIDGENGTDTLNLNLKNSVKNGPVIKNPFIGGALEVL